MTDVVIPPLLVIRGLPVSVQKLFFFLLSQNFLEQQVHTITPTKRKIIIVKGLKATVKADKATSTRSTILMPIVLRFCLIRMNGR